MLRNMAVRYRYLTPIDKPIHSLALNSLIQLSAESLQYCHNEFGMPPSLSVVLGAFGFRLALEVAGLCFQSLTMRKKDSWAHRWIEKVFLVDLRRDCTFYDLSNEQYNRMRRSYLPETLFSQAVKSYAILNFFRGCHYLVTDPTFQQFCLQALATHDPYFLLPLPIIFINYLIISRSQHPFLIHLVRKQNRPTAFSIAFMTGLVFAALPSVFPLGYIGLSLGHLTLRLVRNRVVEWKKMLRMMGKD